MKKILVVGGSPKKNSFSNYLAAAYASSAKGNYDVRLQTLDALYFNVNLVSGYSDTQPLEPDLQSFQDAILWANHVVIICPIWWGSIPAKLKGLIDRTFLPDFAFKYVKGQTVPKKLLVNKTARLIMTMDTPPWYYRFFQGAPAVKQLKIATLQFSGFKSVKTMMLGPIINSTESKRNDWIQQVSDLGCLAR